MGLVYALALVGAVIVGRFVRKEWESEKHPRRAAKRAAEREERLRWN